jgi:signal transduction histidine kinase
MVYMCATSALAQAAEPRNTINFTRAEAVRSDWLAKEPPVDGWQSVSIPDVWRSRWPEFDGVVWYRLEWEQAQRPEPIGLALEYMRMAGEVSVNGTLLHRDPSLVEPVTRAWNTPRFWIISPPVLRVGKNTMLVRVSGFAAFRGGLGPVVLGSPAAVQSIHEADEFRRLGSKAFMGAVAATLSCVFLILWGFRRSELAFGWFGLNMLVWFIQRTPYVWTIDSWPLNTTYMYQSTRFCTTLLFVATFTMFVFRFCERRFPRIERAMWLLIAALMLWLFVGAHDSSYRYRELAIALVSAAIMSAASISLVVFAWRSKQPDQRMLSLVSFLYVGAVVHDLLVYTTVIKSNHYLFEVTVTFTALAIFWVLALRYARNLRRIENFNSELRQEIETARSELSVALRHQHETEMTHARIGERLNLVRDIHDGLGGSLVGSIAAIEHAPQNASAPYLLSLLKALRDDLRLIIDSAANQSDGDASLGDQLIPIRHRMTRLLDASNIECTWDVDGIAKLTLDSARVLDVLRFLQEALTNVMKHSAATRVTVRVHADANALSLEVIDNGSGIDPLKATDTLHSAGMRNMQARAKRLGGKWHVQSAPGQTTVAIYHVPLAPR